MDETTNKRKSALDVANNNALEEPLLPHGDTHDYMTSPPRRSYFAFQLYKLAAWLFDEKANDGRSALEIVNGSTLEEPLLPRGEPSLPPQEPLLPQEEMNDETALTPRCSRETFQIYNLAVWLFLLTLAWLASKGWCYVGLPYDCQMGWETAGAMEDLQHLFLYGLSLGWMVGILEDERLTISLFRRRYFVLFLFGSAPVFSWWEIFPTWMHLYHPHLQSKH